MSDIMTTSDLHVSDAKTDAASTNPTISDIRIEIN